MIAPVVRIPKQALTPGGCAEAGIRTLTPLRAAVFKTAASAGSATSAR